MTERTIHFLVPYFGSAEYLKQAVESVRQQTNVSWLLTVVEDSDQGAGVGAWLASLADPRIAHEINPTRLGVSGNFQRCLELSRGTHVVFLGYDDALAPTYVADVLESFEADDPSVVQPGVQVIDADGHACHPLPDRIKSLVFRSRWRQRDAVVLAGEPLMASLATGNWTYFPALCWRRDAIATRSFRPDLATTLDLALLSDVILDGGTLAVLPRVGFFYRRHAASASSLTAANRARFREEAQLLDSLALRCRARGWSSAARAARLRLTARLHLALVVAHRARA